MTKKRRHRVSQTKMQREQELLEKLTEAMECLPKKQRRIVVMYYNEQLTMKQIAEVMSVTESRVSQLHAAALFRLSAMLKRYD